MTPAERVAAFVAAWRRDGRKRIAVAFTKAGAIHLDITDLEAVLVELAAARVTIADLGAEVTSLEAEVAGLRESLDEAVADMHEVITGTRELPPTEDADDEQFDLTNDDEVLDDLDDDDDFYAYP